MSCAIGQANCNLKWKEEEQYLKQKNLYEAKMRLFFAPSAIFPKRIKNDNYLYQICLLFYKLVLYVLFFIYWQINVNTNQKYECVV